MDRGVGQFWSHLEFLRLTVNASTKNGVDSATLKGGRGMHYVNSWVSQVEPANVLPWLMSLILPADTRILCH